MIGILQHIPGDSFPGPGGALIALCFFFGIKGRQGRQPSLPGTRPNFPGPGEASCIKTRKEERERRHPYKIRIAISAQASASARA